MRSKDYIEFMNSLDPDASLEEKILDAAEAGVRPRNMDDADAVQVSGVEQYKRPVWIGRITAMAAALAVIVAMGSGIHGIMSNRVGQSSLVESEVEVSENDPGDENAEIEEATEESPLEEDTDEQAADAPEYPENSYDMTTKDGIIAKMLNSVDFYERASGTCVELPYVTANAANIVEFSYNTVTGEYRTTSTGITLYNTYDDLAAGALPDGFEGTKYGSADIYCDGENFYKIDPSGYKDMYELMTEERYGSFADSSHTKRGNTPVNAAKALENTAQNLAMERSEDDYDRGFTLPNGVARYGSPINKGMLSANLPEQVLKCLSDYDRWDFETAEYCGRDALYIHGTIQPVNFAYWNDKHDPSDCAFNMYVDVETGMLLKYVEYKPDGTVYDLFVIHDIHFDDDAAPIEAYDPTGKAPWDPDEAYRGKYGLRKNSKGVTYGLAGTGAELISFGDGYGDTYVYSKELSKIEGDKRFHDTHQIRIGDEEPIFSLDIYTSEGEYVRTVYYYEGYIDE